jgi:hypothetical protein
MRPLRSAGVRFALVLAVAWGLGSRPRAGVPAPASALPERLTDAEFWRLSLSFSEPGGTFHSENYVSNEALFQTVIPELIRRVKPGGFYIGVGPEQNFTYLAVLRPRMAFIVDIRRGNLLEHLLYKALIEMSADRADFLARLFSREKPAALSVRSSAAQIFAALEAARPSESRYRANLQAVRQWLTDRHGFPLQPADLTGIDVIYRTAFFADGPDLNYRLTGQGPLRGGTPTYAELMTADDGTGQQRSYLASEPQFAVVRDLETRNLIVPVVGDFGGPRALRAVGAYARSQGATVTAFYVSNVEQYLQQDGKWEAFCANVASMPIDGTTTFIRSVRGGRGGPRSGFPMFTTSLAPVQTETRGCAVR